MVETALPWDGEDAVNPLVVMKRKDVERSDILRPASHASYSNSGARQHTAGRNDSSTSSPRQKACCARDTHSSEGCTQACSYDGGQKTRR